MLRRAFHTSSCQISAAKSDFVFKRHEFNITFTPSLRSHSPSGGKFLFNIVMANQVRQFYTEGFSDRTKWKASVDAMGALGRNSVLDESDVLVKSWIHKKGGGSSVLGRKVRAQSD